TADRVRCSVVAGGTVRSRKGINLPGVELSSPTLTEKDRADARLAVEFGADYIALSFVRRPDDVEQLRRLLADLGADTPVVAKIERAEAVDQVASIIDAADGVMVAGGDLGVELSEEAVPAVQKRIIARANEAGKLVITATEMLQSMVESRRPTRAEAADVANAILDGTDVVMLSDETSVGAYPVRAVETMERITREAEKIRREFRSTPRIEAEGSFAGAVADAACAAAAELRADAIVVFTMSGRTARLVAQRRPDARIIALTPSEATQRRLRLAWGVIPLLQEAVHDADTLVVRADERLKEAGLAAPGDVIVIVGGEGPLTGATNFTKMHHVR
ncbi:MAG: pyruvate kinase, partial [bacterium]